MNQKNNKLKIIHSKEKVQEFIENLADELIQEFEENIIQEDLFLIGIHTRGVTLANRINTVIQDKTNHKLPTGSLGITLYRDDIDKKSEADIIKPTDLEFSYDDKNIILIDDVLFSGRTIRAALNEIMDYGRPKLIRLLVLIDRCCRQLPIQADYFAKKITSPMEGKILIRFKENDPEIGDGIFIESNQ